MPASTLNALKKQSDTKRNLWKPLNRWAKAEYVRTNNSLYYYKLRSDVTCSVKDNRKRYLSEIVNRMETGAAVQNHGKLLGLVVQFGEGANSYYHGKRR